jgi:circadian clock protein KaiC
LTKQNQILVSPSKQPTRLTSGVPGLETLLKGGFIQGGTYLLLGPPGSGKTILGNQICFHHAKSGFGNVVYVTLLAESHHRMMGSLRGLDYFREDMVAHSIHYFSGYGVLEKDGLRGLLLEIAGIVRDRKATLLMIDGITTIADMDQTQLAFRKFVHELNSFISASGCTAFLLSSIDGGQSQPEHTMVDGIVVLYHQKVSIRAIRQIEVRKFRGSDHLQGEHLFKITEHGVRIYPRAETLEVLPRPVSNPHQRMPFDVLALDEMLGGGLIANSITTIIGPTGTGKTILGLQFLRAGVEAKEPCLFFGFYETPEDLLDKARQIGFSLDK